MAILALSRLAYRPAFVLPGKTPWTRFTVSGQDPPTPVMQAANKTGSASKFIASETGDVQALRVLHEHGADLKAASYVFFLTPG